MAKMKIDKRTIRFIISILLILASFLIREFFFSIPTANTVGEVPEFDGKPYAEINDNKPNFSESDKKREAFEQYSQLDSLGRCQVAYAKIGRKLMPKNKRENISKIRPTGWQSKKYDKLIKDRYLYNRCHLIAFQLAGENANEKNLITGTRYLNVEGMLPFEEKVAKYIKRTGNHVMYRVKPIFEGTDLVAKGVQMEAESVEDDGDEISFNVFVYNNQPGVEINYKTGESKERDD